MKETKATCGLLLLSLIGSVMLAVGCASAPGGQAPPAGKAPEPPEFAGEWGARGTEPNQLSQPQAIATDAHGLVYIDDAATHFIHKFAADGIPRLTFADGGLRQPASICVDRGGAIYVADTGAGRVRIYFPEGDRHLRDLYGAPHLRFLKPTAVAVDDDGNIFVADAGASRIEKLTPRGGLLKVWGRKGTGPGELNSPTGLAVGPDGFLYVADSGNARIEKFTHDGAFVVAWDGTAGGPEQVGKVTGIAVSDKYVFALDGDNGRLTVWSLDGRPVLNYDLNQPFEGAVPRPRGITLVGHELLLVLDAAGPRVLRFHLHL